MKNQITGIMVNYYKVCHRKLWYFYHQIQMEQNHENVMIGKLLDESSYKRDDKHINIDNVINIDFIRKSGVLHEIKKSKKIEEAAILQVKYYLYYLEQKGVTGIKGKIDYPLLKQTVDVELNSEDRENFKRMLQDIEGIVEMPLPPDLKKIGICKSCAYYDLCFI